MSQENDFLNQSTTSSLRVCRGCLDTNARLYDMRQNRLLEVYATLLSTATVQVTEDLPEYLCSYCAVLLLKCDKFRVKCIDSLIVLRKATQQHLDLTVEDIKNIDRPTYFKKSEIEWNSIEDNNLKQKQNYSDISTDGPAIINNVDFDADILHLIKKEDIEFDADIRDLIKKEDIEFDADIRDLIKKEDIELDVPQDKSFFETQCDEINETSDSEDGIAIADLKLNSKPSKCKNISTKAKKVAINNVIDGTSNQKQTIKKRKTVEFFAKRYNTEVRHLSKEEQIKKIQDKKESNNYKNAQFKCNFCFRGFLVEKAYKNHMSLHDDISGKFVCDTCQCHFMTKNKLVAHRLAHSRVFTCKECGYRTKFVCKINEHHTYHNHNGKKFSCEYCGKEYKRKAGKFSHIKKYHPASEQLVRCEICRDSFIGLAGLKYHDKKTHKKMYSPECLCPGCDTQFYCLAAFKAHQETDGLCDATHKYCVRCGMAFETEELLKEHEAEQRKPRNYFECDVCCKTYTLFSSFKTHQRRHSDTHLNFIRKYNKRCKERRQYKNDSDTKLKKVHTEEPSTCDICGKDYLTKYYLKLHIQRVHIKIPRIRSDRKKKTE